MAANNPSPSLRICLAASGGGHVRQLLDLKPMWSKHDCFFITEDTALGRTLARETRTHFVPHFAWGQAKLGKAFRMFAQAATSMVRTAGYILKERPDVVISTGAGAVIFAVLWGRIMGAHVVVIESFARFEKPSLFGRLGAPLAHDVVVQSAKLADYYPRAKVFDPFRYLEGRAQVKEDLLFATVGATLPFDRLVQTVARAKSEGRIPERVVLQTGEGGERPAGLEVHETLSFDEIQALLERARTVVCHGGTGSLITALRAGCHVIAMPRLYERGEHYDDHQAEITEAFAERGLVQVAKTYEQFCEALENLPQRTPVRATTDPQELLRFLEERIEEVKVRRRK